MAGLSCALELKQAGIDVRLFDKGRGPGGRMSTRRMETPIGELRWDHGAQFFTARGDAFQRVVGSWIKAGAAAEWNGTFLDFGAGASRASEKTGRRFVGTPGMNGIIRHMASETEVEWARRANEIKGEKGNWRILFEDGSSEGGFDDVIVAVPAEQVGDLLNDVSPGLAEDAASIRSAPCWAVLLAYDAPLDAGFDGARITGGPLGWIARNTSKPERAAGEAWVLHASPEWSREHVDEQKEEVIAKLIRNFTAMSGAPEPVFSAAHRWLYAMTESNVRAKNFGWDDTNSIGACGDWYIAPRVESAWLSGAKLAKHIAGSTA